MWKHLSPPFFLSTGKEVSNMIQASVETNIGTMVIDLPRSIYDLYEKLSSSYCHRNVVCYVAIPSNTRKGGDENENRICCPN